MTDAVLAVIVPSRGRPDQARELADIVWDTADDVDLFFGVDDDDPTADDYPGGPKATTIVGPRRRMVGTLNALAVDLCHEYRFLGFMGDDHRPRTAMWDRIIASTLANLGTGIAYGDDRVHGAALPTAAFMTADIVRALGWMAPPCLTHLFVDNAWLDMGNAIGLRYLPEVVIEHVHPITGKVAWDDGYLDVNSPDMQSRDHDAYHRWRAEGGPVTAATTVQMTPMETV